MSDDIPLRNFIPKVVRRTYRNFDKNVASTSKATNEKMDPDYVAPTSEATPSDRSQKAVGSYCDSITLVKDDHADGMDARSAKGPRPDPDPSRTDHCTHARLQTGVSEKGKGEDESTLRTRWI
ncbi:hypothetical protein RND71_026673 [Anisodus tanguticus]|uniref:Uncharacterized protein n=1 Tax=Anisodus tanguticus TaxID=243964 RepID=A0AAE1RL94_9SOLA|nr:hypothetical protein RND71_026673 [Anisodus tanguticus]